jgi:hypothetical protein
LCPLKPQTRYPATADSSLPTFYHTVFDPTLGLGLLPDIQGDIEKVIDNAKELSKFAK